MTSSGTTETPLQITALSLDNAVKLLSRMGARRMTVEVLKHDIEAGAPTNPDGSINLLSYGAWVVGRMGSGQDGQAGTTEDTDGD